MKGLMRKRTKHRSIHVLHAEVGKTQMKRKLQRGVILLFWGLVSLVLVAVATNYGVVHLKKKYLYQNAYFSLQHIDIDAKNIATQRDVLAASKLVKGQNVMCVDLMRVQKDVESLPYVAEAQVIRVLPDRMEIKIKERIPLAGFAPVRSDGTVAEGLYLDRDGVLMGLQRGENAPELPVITGATWQDYVFGQKVENVSVLAAVTLIKLVELSQPKETFSIASVDVSKPQMLVVHAEDGARILFRPVILDQQVQRLISIMESKERRQRRVATMDLTLDCNVPVTFSE